MSRDPRPPPHPEPGATPGALRYRARRGRDPFHDLLIPWTTAALEEVERWAEDNLLRAYGAAVSGAASIPAWDPAPRWAREALLLYAAARARLPLSRDVAHRAWFLTVPAVVSELVGDPPMSFLRHVFELYRRHFSTAGPIGDANLIADVARLKRSTIDLARSHLDVSDDDDIATGLFLQMALAVVRQSAFVDRERAAHRPDDRAHLAFVHGLLFTYEHLDVGQVDHLDLADLGVCCGLDVANGVDRRWRERLYRYTRKGLVRLAHHGQPTASRS